MTSRTDPTLTCRMQMPDAATLIARPEDLGDGLRNSAIDLKRECTTERVDQFLEKVKGAEQMATHIRKSLVHDQEARRDAD